MVRPPRHLVLAWLPVALYMATIWLLSSRELKVSLDLIPWKDKGAHCAEYALLAALWARALFRTWPSRGLVRALWAAFVLSVVWGFIDEMHQSFVPGRNGGDMGDLTADSIGALIGVGVYAAFVRLRRAIAQKRA